MITWVNKWRPVRSENTKSNYSSSHFGLLLSGHVVDLGFQRPATPVYRHKAEPWSSSMGNHCLLEMVLITALLKAFSGILRLFKRIFFIRKWVMRIMFGNPNRWETVICSQLVLRDIDRFCFWILKAFLREILSKTWPGLPRKRYNSFHASPDTNLDKQRENKRLMARILPKGGAYSKGFIFIPPWMATPFHWPGRDILSIM